MVRVHLYKGKHVRDGGWISGVLRTDDKGKYWITCQDYEFDVIEDEVIPETIAECFGYKNRYGLHFWEGDVLYTYFDFNCQDGIWIIKYDEDNHRLRLWDGDIVWRDFEYKEMDIASYERVGDVVTRPEFLNPFFHKYIIKDDLLRERLIHDTKLDERWQRVYDEYCKKAKAEERRYKRAKAREEARLAKLRQKHEEAIEDDELPF